MRHPILGLFSVLVGFAVSGCVSTQVTRLSTTQRPALQPDQVTIYRTAAQVPAKYEEVALIASSGDHNWVGEEKIHKTMRQKAAELGANGIILDSMSEPDTGSKVAQAFLGTSAERKGKAIAIFVLSNQQ